MKQILIWLLALFVQFSATSASAHGGGAWAVWARRQWIPRDVPAGACSVWLRPDVGVTTATGVSAWANQAGASDSAAQAIGANQPALTPGTFGAKPSLTFNGTTSSMTIASSSTFSTGTGGYSVFAVYKSPASWWVTQAFRVVFDKSSSLAWASTSDALGIGLAVGNNGSIGAVHAGTNTPILSSATLVNSTKYVLGYTYDGVGTHNIRINGGVNGTAATTTTTNTNANSVGIGWNASLATRFLQGDIGSVVFCSAATSASDISRIEKYLGAEQGIPVP